MPRILVVEDENHLAIGIKFNLEAEGFDVETASDGQAALVLLGSAPQPFDLVVLDVMLPGMSGYAVCEAIRHRGDDVPVVMLTARTLVEDRIRGFDAGTDVYLQKPFDLDELLSIVRSLISRRSRSSRPAGEAAAADTVNAAGPVYRFGEAEVNFDTWESRSQGVPVRLTNLEMKLLRYLVDNEGKVVSRNELLERVWGMARPPATRTIDTFMFNLRKYFEGDPSRPVHFLSVRGMGYRFVGRRQQAAKQQPAVVPSPDETSVEGPTLDGPD
ncbi:MAG: DNA-binding response regulator [Planctomycetota bacterium]|nr:MAG: DNA-binding response regulator [Planctomycetota bacterium]